MIYFIPWVVFLAVVILSVPIAAWLDKRKRRAAYGDQMTEESYSETDEDEVGEFSDAEEQESGELEVGESEAVFEESESLPEGDDDAFAAFQ